MLLISRIVGFMLLSILLGGFVGLNHEDFENGGFTDVKYEDEFFRAILYAKNNNIVQGYSNGEFRAYEELTRYEFTKIIVKALYTIEEVESCNLDSFNFPDIDTEAKAKFGKYICIAKEKNLIKGYSSGFYEGNFLMNAEEAMKVIAIGFGYASADDESTNLERFKVYVTELSERMSIPVSIDNINSKLQRGEMVEIIYRLKNNIIDRESKDVNTMYVLS